MEGMIGEIRILGGGFAPLAGASGSTRHLASATLGDVVI